MYTLNNKSYICTYRSVFLPYVIYVLSSLSHIQTATIVLASVFKNMSFEGRKSVNNVSVQQYYMYKKCVYNKSIELNHSSSVSYKNIFPSISHGTWISIAVRIWDFGIFSIRNTPRLLWSFLLLLNQPVLIVGRNAITVIKIKDFFYAQRDELAERSLCWWRQASCILQLTQPWLEAVLWPTTCSAYSIAINFRVSISF